jgi:hypothetical protein
MSIRRTLSSRLKWTPIAVVVVAAAVLAGTMLANAAGPALPKKTPAQLLLAMRNAKPPAAMSAVITESANLGFPALPNLPGLSSSVFSAASLVSGTHTIDVWYAGPQHVRIALPVSFGETDLRVNGNQIWLWNSRTQTATHYIPADIGPIPARVAKLRPLVPIGRPAQRVLRLRGGGVFGGGVFSAVSPQQAVNRLLAAIGPTTKVSVAGSTVVAGQSAYQLVVAPRTSQSLISQIVIAVDAQNYLPLQLQVFARGMSSPAFEVGFTSLSFATPAMSNFTFTPPPGAHVKTERVPLLLPGLMTPFAGVAVPIGAQSGRSVTSVPGGAVARPAKAIAVIPGAKFPAKWRALRLKLIKLAKKNGKPILLPWRRMVRHVVVVPVNGTPVTSGPNVLGSGWLSVAVIRDVSSISGGPGPLGSIGSVLPFLLRAATPVHGAWGSGRMLRTSLLSALLTSNGTVLIGAVTPAVLYADAAKVK